MKKLIPIISTIILLFVLSLSNLQAQDNSPINSGDGQLISIYSEIRDLAKSQSSDIGNKLDELRDQELFELAKIASSENDTTILYFLIGREFRLRAKTDLSINLFFEQLDDEEIHNNYKIFLLWLLNANH